MQIRTRQYAKYQVKWIRKLLGVELQKEARFGYKYGGKLYMLDATDLQVWDQLVKNRGVSIANQFLESGPISVTDAQIPERLQSQFDLNTGLTRSNKTLGSESNWKHYECSVCKDKSGKPLVSVGKEQWEIHTKSRRHKKQVGYELRKIKHEELKMRYKRPNEESK